MPDEQRKAASEGLTFERQAVDRARRLWRRHGHLPKRWLAFVGVIGVAVALDQGAPNLVNLHFATATAAVAAWILDLFGARAVATNTMIISPYCAFDVIGECTAYYPCAVFVASVLSYPTHWRRKLVGVALGLPLVLLVNQGRLVSLCYIHRRENFEFWHVLVWQPLIIFFTVLVWTAWITTTLVAMKPHLRRVLVFGLTFVPAFVVCLLSYTQMAPAYRAAVFGVANTMTGSMSPPTRIEMTPAEELYAYRVEADGSKSTIGVWDNFVVHLLFLNLALLPALLLATPAPWSRRFRMLLIGLALLFVMHVLSTIGLVRETQSLAAQPGVFHRLWLLRLIYISGQIFAAVLWALLAWRHWFPTKEGTASPAVR